MDRAFLASLDGYNSKDAAFHMWLKDVSPKSGSLISSPGMKQTKVTKVELPNLGVLSSPLSTSSCTTSSIDHIVRVTNLWGTGPTPRCYEFCNPDVYYAALKFDDKLPYIRTHQPTEISHGFIWILTITNSMSVNTSYSDGIQWQGNHHQSTPLVNSERIQLSNGDFITISHCTSADGEMQRRTYSTQGSNLAIVHYMNSGVVATAHANTMDGNPFVVFDNKKNENWISGNEPTEDFISACDLDMCDSSNCVENEGDYLPVVKMYPTIVEQGSEVLVLLPPSLQINVPLGFNIKFCGEFIPTTTLADHKAVSFVVPSVPSSIIKKNALTKITVEVCSAGQVFSQPVVLKYKPSLLSDCYSSGHGSVGWNSTIGEGLMSILREINSKLGETPTSDTAVEEPFPDVFRNGCSNPLVRNSSSFDNLMAQTQQTYQSQKSNSQVVNNTLSTPSLAGSDQENISIWGIRCGGDFTHNKSCVSSDPGNDLRGISRSPKSGKTPVRASRVHTSTRNYSKSPLLTSQNSQPSRKSADDDSTDTAGEEQVRLRKLFFSIIHAVVTENQQRPTDRDFLFAPDSEGITLVHYCAYLGLIGPLDVLLAYAPENYVNISDRRGMSPLHYAVMKDHNDAAIAVLLQAGANSSQQDTKGNTPFSIAAELSNGGIRLMMDAAANISGSAATDFSLEDELLSQLSMFTGSTSMGHHPSGEEWEALDALDSITLASEPLSVCQSEGDQNDQNQVLIIQRNVRKWSAQRQYNLVRRSIETLQAAVRGRMARKEIDRLRKVLTIQRTVRQWLRKRGLSPSGDTDKRLKAVGKTPGTIVSVSTPKSSPKPSTGLQRSPARRDSTGVESSIIEIDIKHQIDVECAVQSDVRQWLQRGQQQALVRRSEAPPSSVSVDKSLSEQLQESERRRVCLEEKLQHEESRQQFRVKLDENLEKIVLLQRNFRKWLKAKPREDDDVCFYYY